MATVLVTAGPTREHLDDVRFLSNGSTGRMGFAIAIAAQAAGHRVQLVSGPTELPDPPGVEAVRVVSALEMAAAVDERFPDVDVMFGVAAVADARPAVRLAGKAPKSEMARTVELLENPDIIATAGARKGRRAIIGFALEALGAGGMDAVLARGRDKMKRKHLDAIAVNLVGAMGADDNEVVVLLADGGERRLPRKGKQAMAADLVAMGVDLWRRRQ